MARAPRRDATPRGGPGVVARYRGLLALGLAALACFAIATLPASLVSKAARRFGLTAAAFSGTIWSGVATGASWQGTSLGDLEWRLRPLALLRGRAAANVVLARPDGSASAAIAAAPGGTLELSELHFDLPLEFLSQVSRALPRGWRGRAHGAVSELELVAGWPVSGRGTLEVSSLVVPRLGESPVGSYVVVVPDPQTMATGSSGLAARVSDKDGLLAVDAVLTLGAGRSFLFEGTVSPRDGTPPDLAHALEFLGPADATGRRQVGASGTL